MIGDAPEGDGLTGEGLGPLLEAVVEACVIADFDGRIVAVNRAAEQMFGWSSPEAAGMEIGRLLFDPQTAATVRTMLDQCAAAGHQSLLADRSELVTVRRDGQEVPVELTLSVIRAAEGPRVAALMLDISERKAAEARSRRCETIISSSGDAIWSGSLDGIIESWNPAAERLYGYSESRSWVGRRRCCDRPDDLEDFTREQWEVSAGGSVLLGCRWHNARTAPSSMSRSRCRPLCDEAGAVSRIVSVVARRERTQPDGRSARRGAVSVRRGV